jgi:hypothetical protein
MGEYIKWVFYFNRLNEVSQPNPERVEELTPETVLRRFNLGP